MERISVLREKYHHLKELLEKYKDDNGNIPFGNQFIGSIGDFNIICCIEKLTDEELVAKFSIEDIEHLIESIDNFENNKKEKNKFNFSLNTIIQIDNLINGKIENKSELLQTLYMTIFQRYNDDIKVEENYKVTPEFANKVYTFDGEDLPDELKNIVSSEKDMGCIYMTQDDYEEILEIWNQPYQNTQERKTALKNKMVNFTLSNIRKRMMHGDFENKIDHAGNKIVEISPFGFKAKFFFDCILEFYEVVSEEIKHKIRKEDFLFDLESVLLKKEPIDASLLCDKDKIMTAILPLYVNSFITYNFNDSRKDIQKLRKQFIQENASEEKVEFLDQYYKKKDSNSFAYKVAEYNKQNFKKDYSAYDIINHFRNSVVHNNFKCENGIIYLLDYDTDGSETARFIIPYTLVEELISNQSELAKKVLGHNLPDAPNGFENNANDLDDIIR